MANLIQHGLLPCQAAGTRSNDSLLHLCHGRQHPQARATIKAPSGTGHYQGKRQRLLNQFRHWQEHFFVGRVSEAALGAEAYRSQKPQPDLLQPATAQSLVTAV